MRVAAEHLSPFTRGCVTKFGSFDTRRGRGQPSMAKGGAREDPEGAELRLGGGGLSGSVAVRGVVAVKMRPQGQQRGGGQTKRRARAL